MLERRDVLKAAAATAAGALSTTLHASTEAVIERDVCIVGGGSAGTYTALRLRDLGRSVLLVEQNARLGGHAETYVDPATGIPIDIGVVVLENNALVTGYLARLGVTGIPAAFPPGDTRYIDTRTGLPVPGYVPPVPVQALLTYRQLLATRYPYLELGFDLPDPVPAELAAPFRDFVRRHGLQDLVPTAWDFGQGSGDLLGDPAIYAMKLFGLSVVDAILGIGGAGFLVLPTSTARIYDQAAAELGPDTWLNSAVRRTDRREAGRIELVVATPAGTRRVRARQLVLAIPPTLANLAPFALDVAEALTFCRLQAQCYATGVLTLSGMPPGVAVRNTGANTLYNLPPLPGLYGLNPTAAPGLWNVKYGAAGPIPSCVLRARIAADVGRLASAGTFPALALQHVDIFSNHTPFQLKASGHDIAHGFYRGLNALQGRRGTFFNGAAVQTNDSSMIWKFTEEWLLPKIVA